MHQVIEKINLKLFIPMSLAVVVGGISFLDNRIDIMKFLVVYFFILLNNFFWVQFSSSFLLSTDHAKKNKGIILFFVYKLFILVIFLTLGVQFVGNKLIISLFNYVLQIFVLGISMKRNGSQEKLDEIDL